MGLEADKTMLAFLKTYSFFVCYNCAQAFEPTNIKGDKCEKCNGVVVPFIYCTVCKRHLPVKAFVSKCGRAHSYAQDRRVAHIADFIQQNLVCHLDHYEHTYFYCPSCLTHSNTEPGNCSSCSSQKTVTYLCGVCKDLKDYSSASLSCITNNSIHINPFFKDWENLKGQFIIEDLDPLMNIFDFFTQYNQPFTAAAAEGTEGATEVDLDRDLSTPVPPNPEQGSGDAFKITPPAVHNPQRKKIIPCYSHNRPSTSTNILVEEPAPQKDQPSTPPSAHKPPSKRKQIKEVIEDSIKVLKTCDISTVQDCSITIEFTENFIEKTFIFKTPK